jgi:hypothetical protein
MKQVNYYWHKHINSPDNSISDVYGTVYIMPGMGQWVLIRIDEGNKVPDGAIHCNDVIKMLEPPK